MHLKPRIFLFLLLLPGVFNPLRSQDYTIDLELKDCNACRVLVSEFSASEDPLLIDSGLIVDDKVDFTFSKERKPGMYRISLQLPVPQQQGRQDHYQFEFVYNYEDISLSTAMPDLAGNLKVNQSAENKLWFTFLRLQAEQRLKLRALFPLLNIYEKDDAFYKLAAEEILSVQKSFNDTVLLMSRKNPDLLASSLASFNREPVYNPFAPVEINDFMKEHYLDPVDFNDPRLIRTNAFQKKIVSYLSFYRTDGDRMEQEKAFSYAVDKIMAEARYNQEVHDFVLNYLIDGFEKFQMESVLVHIADNHLNNECKTEDEEIVKERLEAYKRMSEGNQVGDILLPDPFDVPRRLSDFSGKNVLVVFWSSECPHCTKLLPRLSKWYISEERSSDIEIFAVSIDKDRRQWESFILENDLGFTNVHDFEGWDSKTSRQFNLYATPTMFLLDADRKILAKPVTFREFTDYLESVK